MLLVMGMPAMGREMSKGTIHHVLVSEGMRVERGVPLLEVRVDLSDVAAQNCAPVFAFRVVSAETGWVRSLSVAPGETHPVGAPLVLLSSAADELIATEAHQRALRVSVATIIE